MKDALKRAAQALGFTAPAEAATQETTTEATVVDTVVLSTAAAEDLDVADPLAEMTAKFDAQATALTAVSDQLNSTLESLASKEAELATVVSELADLKAAIAQAESDAATAKLAARQEAIVTALGTERADAFMAATKDMPDAQFKTVMAAMTATTTTEATSSLFVEQGVDAQADVDALQAEAASNGTMELLKAKYQRSAAK